MSSFVIPGSLMMGLVYLGFILLAWELTHSRAAVVVAYLLMFLNGGLGFFYVLDEVWQDPTALKNVFTGYYAAPANMVEHNIRWVNVICDMMIPQRTLLALSLIHISHGPPPPTSSFVSPPSSPSRARRFCR